MAARSHYRTPRSSLSIGCLSESLRQRPNSSIPQSSHKEEAPPPPLTGSPLGAGGMVAFSNLAVTEMSEEMRKVSTNRADRTPRDRQLCECLCGRCLHRQLP